MRQAGMQLRQWAYISVQQSAQHVRVLQVQKALGAQYAIGFDITAACSGFVVALITAAQFIRTGARKNVVVVGADALSRYIDWNDRGAPHRIRLARWAWGTRAALQRGRPRLQLALCSCAQLPQDGVPRALPHGLHVMRWQDAMRVASAA